MAFPTGWNSKHKLTIDNTKVSGSANLTNFPVYLSGDNFLADVFTKAAARREINANWLLSDANLQGYWRLESDGSDETANNYDLTAVNSPTHATGKFGNGVDLERDNTTYYKVASATNLNITSSKTVSCWIKPESTGLWQTILTHSDGTTTGYDFFLTASNTIRFGDWGLTTNDSISSDITLAVGTWYHVVGIWDATNNVISVWVNGVKKSLATTGSSASDTGELRIGADRTPSNAFDGIIDDVAIFNRALSDYEVKALYYGTSDLRFSSDEAGSTELASEVVFFDPDNSLAEVHVKVPTVSYNTDTDFYVWYEASTEAPYAPTATYGSQAVWGNPLVVHSDSSDGSTVFSDSGSSAHVITANGNAQVDTAQTKVGRSSALFDGTGDYLSIPDHANWDFGTGNFTISFWLRLNADANMDVIGNGYTTGWMAQYVTTLSPDRLRLWILGTNYDFTQTLSTATWYHISFTRVGTDLKCFVNGSQIGSTLTSSENISGSTKELRIGVDTDDATYTNGWVDELRVITGTGNSNDWIATEYANQNSPSTFVTESSVVTTVVLNSYKSLLGVGR